MKSSLVRFENSTKNPFRFFEDFDRDFGRFFQLLPARSYELKNGFGACDVEDRDSHYLFTFDLPGIPKNEIHVEVNDGKLRIWGERKSEKKEGDYTERYWGRFERSLPLPNGVDEKHIEAHFDNGVLSLAVPKTTGPKSKSIEIKEKKEGVFSKLLEGKK
jgi:HSP20 family protein